MGAEMGRKIAIIIGHNSKAPGAVRVSDGKPEYVWNSALAARIRAIATAEGRGADVRVFLRQPGLAYTREIDSCYAEVNAWGADVALEFHFNSAAASSATGTEMLYAEGSTAGKALATRLQAAAVAALGLKDRGLKPLARTARGGRSVWAARAPAVMTEWYFGSNRADCAAADANFERLACAVWGAVK